MRKWYAESDGGDCWTGTYWSRQPKTYYVVNNQDEERIDCESMADAKSLAFELNVKESENARIR